MGTAAVPPNDLNPQPPVQTEDPPPTTKGVMNAFESSTNGKRSAGLPRPATMMADNLPPYRDQPALNDSPETSQLANEHAPASSAGIQIWSTPKRIDSLPPMQLKVFPWL